MSLEERIMDHLVRWDELRQRGQTLSAEELCGDDPEALEKVRQGIQRLRAHDSMFGPSDPKEPPAQMGPRTLSKDGDEVDNGIAAGGLRYRPVRFHAKGGQGEVVEAEDEELHRPVALKRIQTRFVHRADIRRRFLREAEITARLQHPGIVPVYGLVQGEDDQPSYAMRFIEGESFKDAIQNFHQADQQGRDPGERSLALRKLLNHFIAVCNTIAYAHSRGILHRDLKPANIMLGKYGEALVVDWGLGKPFTRDETARLSGEDTLAPTKAGPGEDTQMGSAVGTPPFMSPEQAAGRLDQLGPATDVYSLGASLYYLVTGQAPFSSPDPGVMLANVQLGKFAPPRQKNPTVPAALEAICLMAMALQPEERYASAQALADDLEHWLGDEPMTAYAEPWRARLGRWVRKHKSLVGSAAAASALAVTVAVAWGLVETAKSREAQEQYLRSLAEEKKDEAESQRQEADKQRALAQEQRAEADKQRGLKERALYFSQMNMAGRAWHENQMDRMEVLLKEYQQSHPGKEDLRGFEWYYLWRLRHSWLLELRGPSRCNSLAFSPDGRHLACGYLKEVKVWDATSGKKALTLIGHTDQVRNVAFSPDGRRLTSAGYMRNGKGEIKVWDPNTGQEILSLQGHTGLVTSMTFSQDGHQLAIARFIGAHKGEIKLWDATTAQEFLSFKGHDNYIVSMAYSPDGGRLATASYNGEVKVLDATTGQGILSLLGHAGFGTTVGFKPDGRQLVCVSNDGTVNAWDTTTGQEVLSISLKETPNRLLPSTIRMALSPDCRRVASVSAPNGDVKVWDATTGEVELSLKGHTQAVHSMAFSSDGRLATASDDGTVKVWNATTVQEAFSIQVPNYGHDGITAAFSPNGRRLASASSNTVMVWDTTTGEEVLSIKGHATTGWSVLAFSPDGQRLAGAGANNKDRYKTLEMKGSSE